MDNNTKNDYKDLIGLILGIISFLIIIFKVINNFYLYLISLIIFLIGFILSIFSHKKRPLKIFSIIFNGLGIVISLILLIIFGVLYVIF